MVLQYLGKEERVRREEERDDRREEEMDETGRRKARHKAIKVTCVSWEKIMLVQICKPSFRCMKAVRLDYKVLQYLCNTIYYISESDKELGGVPAYITLF